MKIRVAEVRAGEVRTAEVRIGEARGLELKTHEIRGGEVRPRSFAPRRSAERRSARCRFAPRRSTPRRSAPDSFAARRFAPRRCARARWAPGQEVPGRITHPAIVCAGAGPATTLNTTSVATHTNPTRPNRIPTRDDARPQTGAVWRIGTGRMAPPHSGSSCLIRLRLVASETFTDWWRCQSMGTASIAPSARTGHSPGCPTQETEPRRELWRL